MATINELFTNVVNLGLESAKMVVEPKDKALVYAELAKALAMKTDNSIIKEMAVEIEDIPKGKDAIKETPKAKKEDSKKESKEKVKEETKKEVKEEPKKEVKQEVKEAIKEEPKVIKEEEIEVPEEDIELTEEWTDEMMELKSAQMEIMQEYINNYEEESLNGIVEQFSDGNLNSLADISPLNIDAFIAYIKAIEAQYEEEA